MVAWRGGVHNCLWSRGVVVYTTVYGRVAWWCTQLSMVAWRGGVHNCLWSRGVVVYTTVYGRVHLRDNLESFENKM